MCGRSDLDGWNEEMRRRFDMRENVSDGGSKYFELFGTCGVYE